MLKLFKKKLNNYFTGITILLEDLFSHAKCALNMHVGATQALSHSSALWNYCERCVLHYISTSHYPIRTYIYIYIYISTCNTLQNKMYEPSTWPNYHQPEIIISRRL